MNFTEPEIRESCITTVLMEDCFLGYGVSGLAVQGDRSRVRKRSSWRPNLWNFCLSCWKVYLLIDLRETPICCSIYLCVHCLSFGCAPTGCQTHSLGTLGWCSNPLSHPARTLSYKTEMCTLRHALHCFCPSLCPGKPTVHYVDGFPGPLAA